jgi:hypothetical protein
MVSSLRLRRYGLQLKAQTVWSPAYSSVIMVSSLQLSRSGLQLTTQSVWSPAYSSVGMVSSLQLSLYGLQFTAQSVWSPAYSSVGMVSSLQLSRYGVQLTAQSVWSPAYSSIGMFSSLQLSDRESMIRFPAGLSESCSSAESLDPLWMPPSRLLSGHLGLLSAGAQQPGREVDHPPLHLVPRLRILTVVRPLLPTCRHGVHRDTFTFIFQKLC